MPQRCRAEDEQETEVKREDEGEGDVRKIKGEVGLVVADLCR